MSERMDCFETTLTKQISKLEENQEFLKSKLSKA